MREFNVTGLCIPGKHYMADISEKLRQIMAMVEKSQYFTINRARQYGKTTTIRQLEKVLLEMGYQVARISFERIGDESFDNAKNFCQTLLRQIAESLKNNDIKDHKAWVNKTVTDFERLDMHLNNVCKNKKVVLFIDETDKTSDNLVFLRFIGMLRDKYLERENSQKATFQSVILAGVYDIKNLKVKLVKSGHYQLKDGEKRINSPWNIAANFKVDMSFSAPEIATMLSEYEKDHQTGMNIEAVSNEIRAYTSGYPYLVSRLCQIIDEDLEKDWTLNGVQKAVKILLQENNLLFDDMFKNVESDKNLKDLLQEIAINRREFTYNQNNPSMQTGVMFGILANNEGGLAISNKIFEISICDYFISEREIACAIYAGGETKLMIIQNGKFNMEFCIKKFMQHYYELYHKKDNAFLERECRLLFLTYLKPLINGTGFYHIESETRNSMRTDLIIDYGHQQFIVELKIWHGEQKREKAYEQLIKYLDSKNKSEGYLLTFDFRKRKAKKPSAKWVRKSKKKFLDCLCV